MSTKKFSVVQVNHQVGPKEFNNFYLPYSGGVLAAFAMADISVSSKWQLDSLIWRRDPVEQVAQQLKHCDCVALSTYIWNKNWNYSLGERLKQLNPEMTIVLGGPEVAHNDVDIFHKHPWMDIIVVLEGEYTFRQLLKQDFKNLNSIPGLVINQNNKSVNSGNSIRVNNLEEIPSPYLSGIFNNILKNNPECNWAAIIETNRGCPYQCTFCDWGSLTYSKVKKFNLEKVFAELEWIGQNCEHVSFADANFGMFVERDELILDKLIEVQNRYKKLNHYTITWAKNQNSTVINMAKKLVDESPSAAQALTVSLQSTDEQVLDVIKRKNLKTNRIAEIYQACDRLNIPVETELIVGLPGDTFDKWKNNFYTLFELGNHHGLSYYHSQLLENAEMNISQKEAYQLQGSKIYDYIMNSEETDTIQEEVTIVTSTDTISQEQMLDVWTWSAVIRALHIGGLCAYATRFLRKAYNIGYREFYEEFIPFLLRDPWWATQFNETKYYYTQWIKTGKINVPPIQGENFFYGWNLYMRLQVLVHHEKQLDNFYKLLKQFISKNYNVKELDDILCFQKNTIMQYESLQTLPVKHKSKYDFYGYLIEDLDLYTPVEYIFDTPENKNISRSLFYKNFHYGRKRYYGNLNVYKCASTVLTQELQSAYS